MIVNVIAAETGDRLDTIRISAAELRQIEARSADLRAGDVLQADVLARWESAGARRAERGRRVYLDRETPVVLDPLSVALTPREIQDHRKRSLGVCYACGESEIPDVDPDEAHQWCALCGSHWAAGIDAAIADGVVAHPDDQ